MLRVLAVALLLANVLCQEDPSVTDDSDGDKEDDGKVVVEQYLNVAKGKPVTQSSELHGGNAARAVDGATNGNWHAATCTHTHHHGVQWWEVDLQSVYNVAYIEVYGRTDCCSNNIAGAKLWLGNHKCADLKDMGKEQMQKIECGEHSVGRKVRIEVNNALMLCEVKVMVKSQIEMEVSATQVPAIFKGEYHGDLLNVAIHKHATQSSTHHGGVASRGVDGFTDQNWNKASCTYARNSRAMTYWEVDLGRVYRIAHIMVYGRQDREQTALNGAVVKIGDRICQTINAIQASGHKVKIDCDGDESARTGRTVRVEKWDSTVTICEVQVLVDPEKMPELGDVIPTVDTSHHGELLGEYFNVAKGKNATASSEPWGGVASRANDGVTAQNYGHASCSHTYNRGNEWWSVDLGRVYQIDHINVWGRDDRESPLQGARLWIGEHRCGTVNAKKKGEGPDVVKCPEEQSAGRYVTIEGQNQYLVLCEVQVMVDKALVDVEPNTVASEGEIIGEHTNVALRKEAGQTSTGYEGVASRVVDGWAYTAWNRGTCAHTRQQGTRRWWVDLGKVYKVDKILIWSRTDSQQDHIKWATVYVGRKMISNIDEELYAERFPITIDCSEKDAHGQIVTIQLNARDLMLCEVQVLVKNEDLGEDEVPSTFYTVENVARWKPTKQSTIAHGGTPDRAVDGYTHINGAAWHRQSCIHTESGELHFWEVDLLQEYYVERIFVLARSDSGREQMDGNLVTMDGNTVAGLVYTDGKLEYDIPMFYSRGRHFRLTKAGPRPMMFCEFAVYVNHEYDPEENADQVDLAIPNIAHKKTATSSSESLGGSPEKAVDGDTEGNFFQGSCMSTGVQQGAHWWSVDLVDDRSIGLVIVFPRVDRNLADYIHSASVFVGEELCGTIEYEEYRRWYTIDCEGKTGSTVSVKKDGMLQMCEVVIQDAN